MAQRTVVKKPVVPDDTCPYIDMVQSLVEQIADGDDAGWRRDQATLAKALLEHIRESNLRLRNSSKFWYGKYRP